MKFLASQNAPGSTTIFTDLKSHFKGGVKAQLEVQPDTQERDEN
ncbi:hypothetical protein [Capnocytophaga canimorsus]|nr:hypothetical protein [Capnocytophaga canimorsus]GIM58802.1 hypothetical protein CAPN007_10100 [Capnocytophaga canimorsus]